MTLPQSSDIPPPSPTARVWSPPDIGEYKLVQLGKHQGHWIHWRGKRSEPCLGADCPKSRHRYGADWRAYTPAALWVPGFGESKQGHWKAVVIGLGAENFKILNEERVQFPGPAFTIKKPNKSNSYILEVWPKTKLDNSLPECPVVAITLHRLWKIRYDVPSGEIPDDGKLGE